jgi:hypothetical protein
VAGFRVEKAALRDSFPATFAERFQGWAAGLPP